MRVSDDDVEQLQMDLCINIKMCDEANDADKLVNQGTSKKRSCQRQI